MIYAYCTDGLDYDKREEFDRLLVNDKADSQGKAARERDAVQSLLNIPGVAR